MDAKDIVDRWNRQKAERGNWESLWRDAANYVLTRKNNIGTTVTGGTNRDVQVFDTTACRSNEKLASGRFSYLCPPNEIWFTLRSSHRELMDYEEVSNYFDEVGRVIREALYLSNFMLEIHEALLDDGCFGTGNLYVGEGTQLPLNFKAIHIDEYCISENSEGYVDTVMRYFRMTIRQAAQKFGRAALHQDHLKLLEDPKGANLDKEIEIIHVVMPREDRAPDKMDSGNMPYASLYIDVEHKHLLSESGYFEQPYRGVPGSPRPATRYGAAGREPRCCRR
jgi:hypothetical protein